MVVKVIRSVGTLLRSPAKSISFAECRGVSLTFSDLVAASAIEYTAGRSVRVPAAFSLLIIAVR